MAWSKSECETVRLIRDDQPYYMAGPGYEDFEVKVAFQEEIVRFRVRVKSPEAKKARYITISCSRPANEELSCVNDNYACAYKQLVAHEIEGHNCENEKALDPGLGSAETRVQKLDGEATLTEESNCEQTRPAQEVVCEQTRAEEGNQGESLIQNLDGESDKEFDVEAILARRMRRFSGKKRGREEFLVKWAGYSLNDATWEPRKNLGHCLETLQIYVDKVKRERVGTRTITRTKARRGGQIRYISTPSCLKDLSAIISRHFDEECDSFFCLVFL